MKDLLSVQTNFISLKLLTIIQIYKNEINK